MITLNELQDAKKHLPDPCNFKNDVYCYVIPVKLLEQVTTKKISFKKVKCGFYKYVNFDIIKPIDYGTSYIKPNDHCFLNKNKGKAQNTWIETEDHVKWRINNIPPEIWFRWIYEGKVSI